MSTENQEVIQEVNHMGPSRLARFARFVLRALVLLVVGVGLSVGAYYGIPELYQATIAPMQENEQRITDLEVTVEQEQNISRRQIEQVGERLAEIEGRQMEQSEMLGALSAEIEHLQEIQEQQRDQVDRLLELMDQVEILTSEFEDVISRVDTLEVVLLDIQFPAEHLERQMHLIQAMTLLTRARLWLIQDNLGMASDEVEAAREVLTAVIETGAEEEVLELMPIVERLDLALEDIRITPTVAADELEIAWKLLVEATTPGSDPFEDSNDSISEED